jgi:methylated-DNA-protein-cysteine methyltransferase related protein
MRKRDPMEKRVVTPGFHGRVFELVREVPAGWVTTYGHIATLLGSPRVARHVGWALAASSNADEPVPWQRVINSRGRISYRSDTLRGGEQRQLLEAEGVTFDARGRVDLKAFGWKFPGRTLGA